MDKISTKSILDKSSVVDPSWEVIYRKPIPKYYECRWARYYRKSGNVNMFIKEVVVDSTYEVRLSYFSYKDWRVFVTKVYLEFVVKNIYFMKFKKLMEQKTKKDTFYVVKYLAP